MVYTATTPVASAARTATGQSAAISIQPLANNGQVALVVSVTAASGTTPTLDLTVEWSMDGTTFVSAQPADSFTQITAVSAATKVFSIKGAFYRVKWTIGGTTPSFTFTVGEVQY